MTKACFFLSMVENLDDARMPFFSNAFSFFIMTRTLSFLSPLSSNLLLFVLFPFSLRLSGPSQTEREDTLR